MRKQPDIHIPPRKPVAVPRHPDYGRWFCEHYRAANHRRLPKRHRHLINELERQRILRGYVRTVIDAGAFPYEDIRDLLRAYLNYLRHTLKVRGNDPCTVVIDRTARGANAFRAGDRSIKIIPMHRPDNIRGYSVEMALMFNAHRYPGEQYIRILCNLVSTLQAHPGTLLIIHATGLETFRPVPQIITEQITEPRNPKIEPPPPPNYRPIDLSIYQPIAGKPKSPLPVRIFYKQAAAAAAPQPSHPGAFKRSKSYIDILEKTVSHQLGLGLAIPFEATVSAATPVVLPGNL